MSEIIGAPHPFLKLKELCQWLGENGIREHTVLKLIAAGSIKKRRLARADYYCASEIEREILMDNNRPSLT